MVAYDTTILPGREGKITPEINLGAAHEGFNKNVTVNSNATNSPSLRLSISGKIMAIINVSTQFLRLGNDKAKQNTAEVVLSCQKPDLKIEDVTFEASADRTPQWQGNVPVPLLFSVKRAEKANNDGYFDYTVTLSLKSPLDQTRNGDFVIRTNHAEKSEVKIRGILELPSK